MGVHNISNNSANAIADAYTALFNGGTAKCYSGAQPANVDTALSGNTLLGTLTVPNPAAGSAAAGVATFNGMPWQTTAAATGDLSFARVFKSDGTTAVADVPIALSGANVLVADALGVQSGGVIKINSFTVTFPKQ